MTTPRPLFDTAPGRDEAGHSDSSFSARDAARLASEAAARYYERAHKFRFEPLRSFDQFLVLCLVIFLCLALLYYWRSVVKCVLGDDKIRIDRFHFVYWLFFQCCGCCDGEWTRCLSWLCCCVPSWQGRNLKRLAGESLGLYPVSIRLQNIVVGGLPQDRYAWFPRSPDLFLQIIPDEASPTLNTEVVNEANTECVQFTSSLTMLVKNNASDDNVRFIVKRMHLTGSTEVASCSVNPARLVMWAQERKKRRIQLGGKCRQSDPLCMPWILLDLSIPPESRYLKKQVGAFTPIISASSERGLKIENSAEQQTMSLICGTHAGANGYLDLPMETDENFFAVTNAVTFKDGYPLLNSMGAEVENDELDPSAGALLNARSCANLLACWLVVLFVLFVLMRMFTSGCLLEYKQLEATRLFAESHGVAFDPTSRPLAEAVEDLCHFQVLNLEIFEHIIHADGVAPEVRKRCFPRLNYQRCAKIRNTTTPSMGVLPCIARTCSFDYQVRDHDTLIMIVLLISFLGIGLRKLWEVHTLNMEVINRDRRRTPSSSPMAVGSTVRSARIGSDPLTLG